MAEKMLNPKHEIRNSKQIRMTETEELRPQALKIGSFEFLICFEFRYSNFEF